MSFLIKSAYRLKAAEDQEKQPTKVTELSDSSLRRIANDDEDQRSHQAEQELQKRQESPNYNVQYRSDNKDSSSDHRAKNVYKEQNLIKNPKDKRDSVNKQTFKEYKPLKKHLLDEKQATEVGEITKEAWKYAW